MPKGRKRDTGRITKAEQKRRKGKLLSTIWLDGTFQSHNTSGPVSGGAGVVGAPHPEKPNKFIISRILTFKFMNLGVHDSGTAEELTAAHVISRLDPQKIAKIFTDNPCVEGLLLRAFDPKRPYSYGTRDDVAKLMDSFTLRQGAHRIAFERVGRTSGHMQTANDFAKAAATVDHDKIRRLLANCGSCARPQYDHYDIFGS